MHSLVLRYNYCVNMCVYAKQYPAIYLAIFHSLLGQHWSSLPFQNYIGEVLKLFQNVERPSNANSAIKVISIH